MPSGQPEQGVDCPSDSMHSTSAPRSSSSRPAVSDPNIRRLEVEALTSLLRDGEKCLGVGCGDGSVSLEISRARRLDLLCIDRDEQLVRLARRQARRGIPGGLTFASEDVLRLGYREAFDAVFTDRSVSSLVTWKDQKRALLNLARALRRKGRLILLEFFEDGLATLNAAREEIGLEPSAPPRGILPLDKTKVTSALAGLGVSVSAEHNFLSTYSFGSRVLYPALAKAGGKKVVNSPLFACYFSMLPSFGTYSDVRILVYGKGRYHYS